MDIESSIIVPIIVALIGVIGILIPIIVKMDKGLIRKIFWTIVILLIVSIGVLVCMLLDYDGIKIEITHPKEGEVVEIRESVKGRCKNIKPDQKIWIVVYSYKDSRYFPHKNHANTSDDTWMSPEVEIGGTGDNDKKFIIQAILVLVKHFHHQNS